MNSVLPRIGLTMRHNLTNETFFLAKYYAQAIFASGGLPVHLSLIPKKEYITSIAADLDGLLLPGGGDINPLRFGVDPHPRLGTVSDLRDETDLLTLEAAERFNLPLFGICYGMQIINVFRGGKIIQDIESEVPNAIQHESGEPRERLSHRLLVEEQTRIGRLAGSPTVSVNSHHHQAVAELGDNLVVAGRSSDGIVEAFEETRSDKFVLGVQWHPELCFESDKFSQKLFASFVAAARTRRSNRAEI